jgi:hypothetical protein
MWVAMKYMDVGKRQVVPGDAVPEVDTWPDPTSWINCGYIRWIPDAPQADAAQVVAEAAPAPVAVPPSVMGEPPALTEASPAPASFLRRRKKSTGR